MELTRSRRDRKRKRVDAALAALELPEAVFRTCPWQPRELVETGLRQWLRCCAPTLADRQTIGMPSHAVDEAWHGFILCTALYSVFCDRAYGRYLHHHPEGAAPYDVPGAADPMTDQLGRTVVAWSLVAHPGSDLCLRAVGDPFDRGRQSAVVPAGHCDRTGERDSADIGQRRAAIGSALHPRSAISGCAVDDPNRRHPFAFRRCQRLPGATRLIRLR